MWKIKRKNQYGTLWVKKAGLNIKDCKHSERERNGYCPHCETGTKNIFVEVRKMFTHGGYNPKSIWYVFYGDNHSDLNADYVSSSRIMAVSSSRIMAEKNAVAWMRKN